MMRNLIAILALLALATPAAAQSTYIGGSAVVDIARFDKVEFDDDLRRFAGTATSADGEAIGFNVRIGRALGERWGLEFEFARSGSIENRVSFGVPFLVVLRAWRLRRPEGRASRGVRPSAEGAASRRSTPLGTFGPPAGEAGLSRAAPSAEGRRLVSAAPQHDTIPRYEREP